MGLVLLLALGAAAGVFSFWVYTRWELPVAGRARLAVLRTATFTLLLLLVFDVHLPLERGGPASPPWVLLDASLSMTPVWDTAVERARAHAAAGHRVVGFGDGLVAQGAATVPDAPEALHTRLAPALERAAEAGVEEVVVVSDFRLEDPVAVKAALEELPLRVTFEPVGGVDEGAGVARFRVPDAARPDDRREATVELFGDGADSAEVVIRAEGIEVARSRVALPGPGLTRTVRMSLPPAGRSGRFRYEVRVRTSGGDPFPDDDAMAAYARTGVREGAVVLVSFAPDWEARWLLPLLGRVTGLPTAGYLSVGQGRFATMGRAEARSGPVDSTEVREALTGAALAVFMGVSGRLDGWARRLVHRTAAPTLAFAGDAGGAALLGVTAGSPRQGEWYASAEVPPSPVATGLAGARWPELPPLTDLLPVAGAPPGFVPLEARAGGVDRPRPVLVLQDGASPPRAVVLARDFRRWAARSGAPQDAYQRLWSAVAGWLLTAGPEPGVAEPRPERWVVPRGEDAAVLVPEGLEGAVRWQAERVGEPAPAGSGGDAAPSPAWAEAPVVDTLLNDAGRHVLGALEPGVYRYRAQAGSGPVLAQGTFDVASATTEMLPPVVVPDLPPDRPTATRVSSSTGRPLRTLPWPYLAVLALLCIEWIARRRAGLR